MVQKGSPPIELLVADDSAADVYLVREALKDNVVPVHVSVVPDGVEALAFLRREFPYTEGARPALVLLDLMPRKSGYEVVAEIRADARLDDITVVVFTSSKAERDRIRVLALGAQDFCSKPTTLEEFLAVVRTVVERWGGPVLEPPAIVH